MIDDGMEEIVEEFLAESAELLEQVEQVLVRAESETIDDSDIAAVFRAIHTIKGTAAFLGFDQMSGLAHNAEHLLSLVRDHTLALDTARVSALLATLDALRGMLSDVELDGGEGSDRTDDIDELVVTLAALATNDTTTFDTTDTAGTGALDESPGGALSEDPDPDGDVEHLIDEDASDVEDTAGEQSSPISGASIPTQESRKAKATGGEASSIRVDVGVLDRLIDLVGELVLARNQLIADGIDMGTAGQRLNHVVTELQEGIMRTRMQPVATLLAKAPRIARDAAQAVGRHVRVDIDAGDTELDRSVLEAIRDPLTHLLRNAVDHGIERPAERSAVGKNPEGLISVRAWHEGGHVVVEIRDDGRGIDATKVTAKAIERGLIEAGRADSLSERDIHQLLMAPGFSTADHVTAVSGRGVGMDVVRANIERIGGTVDVESWSGQGTAWRLRIPLTLAILPVLVIDVADHRLAVPSTALREALRVAPTDVEHLGGRFWLRLRGELLPLVDVGSVLGCRGSDCDRSALDVVRNPDVALAEGTDPPRLRIVVVGDGGRRVGLVVDEIGDPAEIVVKPLGGILHAISELAGATVMGDGRIAYILDITKLANRDGLDGPTGAVAEGVADTAHQGAGGDVIVATRNDERLAFDVDDVERLERFDAGSYEWSGGRCLVQYRGELLRIFDPDPSGNVIVCRRGDELVGVGVSFVDDVADVTIDDDGTVVVDGAVARRISLAEVG